jgi:tetratricopeptide (TPR) repeat protein
LDKAIGHFDLALDLNPNYAHAWFWRGAAKREIGDFEGAQADYSRALELSPDEPEFLHYRAMLRVYVQDYAGAVVDCDRFLELVPGDEFILMQRAQAKDQLDDHAGAVDDYTLALAVNPDNAEIRYLRGFARADLEDWDGAVEDFTAVMTMQPIEGALFDQHHTALLRRAQVKQRAGDYAGAADDCTLAIERFEDDLALEARFIRGLARTADKRFAEAVADFDAVIGLYPMPQAFHERGLARQGLGDVVGAEEDFAEATARGYRPEDSD